MDVHTLEVPVGELVFEAEVAGERGRELVLLLHGFPQTSHTYRHALPLLARAGYFAVAPNQRGYSPKARPEAVSDYATENLVADALAIARACGAERFHLVGHDWGGQLAWLIAANYPSRLRTLSVLSRPHPRAFASALKSDAAQADRSRHHRAYDDPQTGPRLLEDGARRLTRTMREQGVPAPDIEAYLRRVGEPAALEGALNWYRAARSGKPAAPVADISVPTLYVWGDADATVGRAAAEATARYVTAPYRFEEIAGAGHFLTDQVGPRITQLLLQQLATGAR
jgi:pimeloyl-ACP methyl ester carboxylesterase